MEFSLFKLHLCDQIISSSSQFIIPEYFGAVLYHPL
jgi:hypothetical protein